jgi:hypothetical protein
MTSSTEYHGWKNRQTWNLALWLQNDEPIYRFAREFVRLRRARKAPIKWPDFLAAAGLETAETPDGVKWADPAACKRELQTVLRDLGAD